MSLQSLPEEILLRILSYLPFHADAAALSSQCHRWHQLCDMSNRRKYRRVKLRETLDLAVALRMLRSILKTPQYGEYVRYIELNRSPSLDYSFYVRSYEIKPPQRSLRPKDRDRLTQAIKGAGFDSPEGQEKVLNVLLQSPATMEEYLLNESEDRSSRSHPAYQQEWADELQELPPEQSSRSLPGSLLGLPNVKNLSLGIHLLYYLSRGIGADQVDDASFAIVDHLPPKLEALCIYGYKKGMKPQVDSLPHDVFDRQIEKLLAEKDRKLPRLSYIEGIDEFIENATTIEQPETNDEDLWERETDDEWTDYEYD
ncbi:hypothetical protein PENSUB_796 [Penicillium subrubescens]|uniref:F-box domain-containing protein n=1 Tax=Penicillium subrubescens TaxID=1316194 RepID=A0A1Q5UM85_9EURO|nr:hypothetical protein PENSUB_796 [Penicillium subrubescens]